MCRIKTERFSLEFAPTLYEKDIACPVNLSLGIKVTSYGFSADSIIDIGISELSSFALQLKNIYENLSGIATLKEPYGSSFVELSAISGGHINVKGQIREDSFAKAQELKFENEIDQTQLKQFVEDLLKYCKGCNRLTVM